MKLSRPVMNAVILAVSVALAGVHFADSGTAVAHRFTLIAVNAESSDNASIGVGREATIIKPLEIPTAAVFSHGVLHYTVVSGDTVAQVARRHGIPEEAVRWSNLASLSRAGSEPTVGSDLLLPPVAGIAMITRPGDTITGLADRFHVDATSILDFNRLRLTADDAPQAGLELVVPAGRGPELAPAAQQSRPAAGFRSRASTVLGLGARVPVVAGNRFAFGNCTYYVFNRRPVPWQGDAWAWYGNAQALGFSTGQTPRPGAIMVTWESGYGHVAYVESVNGDGSWIVSEMNYVAFNTVDRRLIHPGGVPLIGFIY
jgi:surface antigen